MLNILLRKKRYFFENVNSINLYLIPKIPINIKI